MCSTTNTFRVFGISYTSLGVSHVQTTFLPSIFRATAQLFGGTQVVTS
jgi:hypothetical protein